MFKPTAEQAFRSIQSAARRRLNTALAITGGTMRHLMAILVYLLTQHIAVAADCPIVKLSEDVNAFSLWVGLVTKAQVDITACEHFRVDVSDYMAEGEALEDRPASNLLYVQIEYGDTRYEISQKLLPTDRVVTVDFSIGKLIKGSVAPKKLEPGQSVMFGIGENTERNFNSYLLAHGSVKSDG